MGRVPINIPTGTMRLQRFSLPKLPFHTSGETRRAHSVSLVLGNLDNLGELDVSTFDLAELVEDVRQGTGEDTFDLDDLRGCDRNV